MLMLDVWRRRPFRDRRVVLEKLPFLAVSLLFGAVVMDVQAGGDFHGLLTAPASATARIGGADDGDLWRRIATPAHSYMTYVGRLFAPVGLSAIYPYPFVGGTAGLRPFAGPLFLLVTVGLALWDLRRTRLLAFAVGWYLTTIALTLQWVPVGPVITQSIPIGWAVTADRYTYLPYLGPFFALAMGMDAAFRRERRIGAALWAAGALFAAFLFVQARRQIETWSSSESLWSRTIEVHPGLALAYVYRGKDRDASGHTREAARDFRNAFDLGLKNADVNEGLGSTSVALGMLDSAAVQFDRAVRADPSRGRSYYNRAVVLLRLGRASEAVADLDSALARLPGEAATLLGARGYARLQTGDVPAAVADFDRAIAAGSRDPGVHYGRGQGRLRLGDAAGAAEDFRQTLRLDPGHARARARLDEMRR
jgi:tetratricopeptide (TPR) repeat protein